MGTQFRVFAAGSRQKTLIYIYIFILNQVRWCTLVSPANQEAETGVLGLPGQHIENLSEVFIKVFFKTTWKQLFWGEWGRDMCVSLDRVG